MIRIFCDRKQKDLKNFWGHIVFHPTNAIEDDWGKLYLDRIAKDGAAKTVRIYSMFEESVTLNDKGEMVFDFSKSDMRIDYLVSKGFDLFIAYAFIPPWLANEQEEKYLAKRYKGTNFYRSRPSDYSKWEEICRVYTKHLIDRYGEDTVSKWRMHCYNEPDWYHFFYAKTGDNIERAKEYCKLYESFVNGVTSISEKIQIGGPALAESPKNFEFLEYFLTHVKNNNLRLDFISFHSYGTFPEMIEDGRKPTDSRGAMFDTMTVQKVAKMCGFENTPLVCDEWGAITEGYLDKTRIPEMAFRENEEYSAYFVRMLTEFDELNLPYEQMMICLSGQHNLRGDLLGNRNFFSKSYYPKPIFNAYVLANKLGDEKLYHYNELDDEFVSVMATRHSQDGHYSILMCYGDDGFKLDRPTKDFDIELTGLTKNYKVSKYVIDKHKANCYTKFLELGEPQDASEEVKQIIRDAGELKEEFEKTVSPTDYKLKINMSNNAVVLLEVYPE